MRRRFAVLAVLLAALVWAAPAAAHGGGHVSVTLTGTPNPVTAGGTVAYVTSFSNQSSKTQEGVTLHAPAPAGASVVTVISAGACTTAAAAADCTFGDLYAGGTASATVIMTVPSTPGSLSSSVTWSTGDGDHDADDQDFVATTSVLVKAPSPDAIAEYVLPAGDTVSTGNATSPANPQSTTVAVPSTPTGAATSLAEVNASGPTDACGPGATCFGQISVVTILVPPFSAADPLHLRFLIDSSELPKHVDADDLPMFHDGVLVPKCTSKHSTVASPDPCVSARKIIRPKHCKKGAFTVEIDVNSTTNGRWRP